MDLSIAELGLTLKEMCLDNSTEPNDPNPHISVPQDQQREFAFGDQDSPLEADTATIARIDYAPSHAGGVVSITLKLKKGGIPYHREDDKSEHNDGWPGDQHEIVWANGALPVLSNECQDLFYDPDPAKIAELVDRGIAINLSEHRTAQVAAGIGQLVANL